MEKLENLSIAGGSVNGTAPLETSLAVSDNVQHILIM